MALTVTYSISLLLDLTLPAATNVSNSDTVGFTSGGFATVAETSLGGALLKIYDALGSVTGGVTFAATDSKIAQLNTGYVAMAGTHTGGGIDFTVQTTSGFTTGAISTTAAESNADIAALAYTDGHFVVVDQKAFSGSTDHDIIIRIRDGAGAAVGTFIVDSSLANDQNACVTGLIDGGFVVAWERIDASGDSNAWMAVYNADGSVRSAPRSIAANAPVEHQMAVTALASGGFAIAYEDNQVHAFDTGFSDIEVQNFDANGNGNSALFVDFLASEDREAAVTTLSNGLVLTTFTNVFDALHDDDDLRATLSYPTSQLPITDRNNPLVIDGTADSVSESSVSALGLAQFVVSYSSTSYGEVREKTFQLVRTAIGDAGDDVFTGDDAVDVVNGLGGDDNLSGGANNDSINGGDGNDLLSGGVGKDALNGGANVDYLLGGDGDDVLDGGTAGDALVGGRGDDTYIVDNAGDEVSETSTVLTEIDTVRSSVSFTLGANIERLVLTGGGAVNGVGNTLGNTITGNGAANVMRGGGGSDVLDGGAGIDTADYRDKTVKVDVSLDGALPAPVKINNVVEDTIKNFERVYGGSAGDHLVGDGVANYFAGNSGDDTLNGGIGNDTLVGGTGNDSLTGGANADVFQFNTPLGVTSFDTITDFSHTDDTIQLDDAIFKTLGTSVTSGEFYAAPSANRAHDADDRIIYDTTSHKLYFDDDGNKAGGHAAVQFALLISPTGTLAYNDFTII